MNDTRNIGTSTFEQLGLGPAKADADDRRELGQDEFFELMVAQITNQDPLQPLANEEFISQVAQLSTVSGVQSIERSITELASTMSSSQALQASTLVGSRVLAASDVVHHAGDAPSRGAADLAASSASLVVTIEAPNGQPVRRLELGAQPPGLARFEWDGRAEDGTLAAAGNYVVRATSGEGDQAIAVDTLVESRVSSVSMGRNPPSVTLNVDGVGSVGIDTVREFL